MVPGNRFTCARGACRDNNLEDALPPDAQTILAFRDKEGGEVSCREGRSDQDCVLTGAPKVRPDLGKRGQVASLHQ
jgi:hypothetical protein